MRKILILATVILLCASVARTQQSGIPSTLRVLTDANGYLIAAGAAQTSPVSQPTTFSNTRLRTDSNGYLVVVISGGTISSAVVINLTNLVTTSTDGLSLVNTTAATSLVPVQISPRLRLRGSAWNTTVTAATNTLDWWLENLPASATTPTSTLKFGHLLQGGAATYPMTLSSIGRITLLEGLYLGSAGFIGGTTKAAIDFSTSDGKLNIVNAAFSAGIGFDVTTDSTLQLRSRAQNAYGSIKVQHVTAVGNLNLATDGAVSYGSFQLLGVSTDGKLNLTNNAVSAGVGIDVTTDFLLKIRNRAQTADAQIQVSDIIITGQVLARESFDQPHFIRKVTAATFGAKGLADGDENIVIGSLPGIVEYREEQTKTVSSFVDTSGALNLDGENVDEDGVEIALGDAQSGSSGWIITGTSSTTCFTVSVTVGDNAGTDQLFIGWRTAGAFNTDGLIASYSEYAGIGINNVDGSIFAQHEIATAATSDDTGVNWGDAETRLLKSCITATTRVPTAYYTAAGGTTFTQVTLTNSGGAQTTATPMFPFIAFLKETTTDGNFFINYWEITR